jgi:CRP/FNR family cyclic AMP-dependent transcriptional regulator
MKASSPFYPKTIEVLNQSDLFFWLDKAVIQDMLLSFKRQTWLNKSIVMTPEQTTKQFCVLILGRVKITRINPCTGKELTLFLKGPGDGFDIISLLDNKIHNISVVALDDVEAITVKTQIMHEWIEKHPEFNKAFLPYVAKHICELENLASDLALHDTGTRLLKLFLYHTDKNISHPYLKLIHDLSHEELAKMIGSVRVVVNRYLQILKKEGIISAERGHLEIKDLRTLVEKIENHLF